MFQTSVNLMPVERDVGVEVWWGQGWTKFEKGGRKYRAGLHKIGVLGTLCQQFSSHKFKQLILRNVNSLKETDFFVNEDYSKERQWQSEKKSGRKLNNYENRGNIQSLFTVSLCGERKILG